jgi:fucose permease
VAVLIISAMLASLSFVRNISLLFFVVLFLGLGQGATEVGSNIGVIRIHNGNAGPFMNGLHLSFGIGATFCPIILSLFLRCYGSPRYAFCVLAAYTALAGILALMLPEGKAMLRQRVPAIINTHKPFLIILFAVLFLSNLAVETSFSGWIHSYAVYTELVDVTAANYLTSAFWAALTLGRLTGIVFVRILGTAKLLFITCIAAAITPVVFLLFPAIPAILWITAILLGFFQASIIPAAMTLAGEQKILTGTVAGIFVAASSIGGMIPTFADSLIFSIGPRTFPALLVICQGITFISLVGILQKIQDAEARVK